MKLFCDTFRIPSGSFAIAVDEAGALVAAAFGDETAVRRRIRAGKTEFVRDRKRTAAARTQITEYFRGERSDFDLPLAAAGSPFQRRVWAELRRIPAGETRSYGELARRLHSSPRAVGRANGTNPVCVVVPCHRVIGADGSLTGYAFGCAIKRRLLALEQR